MPQAPAGIPRASEPPTSATHLPHTLVQTPNTKPRAPKRYFLTRSYILPWVTALALTRPLRLFGSHRRSHWLWSPFDRYAVPHLPGLFRIHQPATPPLFSPFSPPNLSHHPHVPAISSPLAHLAVFRRPNGSSCCGLCGGRRCVLPLAAAHTSLLLPPQY